MTSECSSSPDIEPGPGIPLQVPDQCRLCSTSRLKVWRHCWVLLLLVVGRVMGLAVSQVLMVVSLVSGLFVVSEEEAFDLVASPNSETTDTHEFTHKHVKFTDVKLLRYFEK